MFVWRAGPTDYKEHPKCTMPSTALILTDNLSRNVSTHLEEAKTHLSALATIYLVTEVSGQSPVTLDAKRRDLQRFLTLGFSAHSPKGYIPEITRAERLQERRGWTR